MNNKDYLNLQSNEHLEHLDIWLIEIGGGNQEDGCREELDPCHI